MRRIAVGAASVAITATMLCTATPAQADAPDHTTKTPWVTISGLLHHALELHYLQRDPHMTPRGVQHSVRKAHRPGR